jgi:3'-phosphoadenosine 5'-phosphosulfate sulfotransferase (PAPS reductase)/FAD synthetase
MSIDNTRIDNAHIDGGPRTGLSTLDALESEAIHIIREVAAEFDNPVLLFSGGKDSVTVLHLAAKAFWPAKIPFGLLHVDTGHNFPEILAFRDRTAERFGLDLTVAKVQGLHRRRSAARTPRRHPQHPADAAAHRRHRRRRLRRGVRRGPQG